MINQGKWNVKGVNFQEDLLATENSSQEKKKKISIPEDKKWWLI